MKKIAKTMKQKLAVSLMSGASMFILLFGGSRSGKTFIIIYAMIVRALSCPDSRHLILRFRFNHAKVSIWYDTLHRALKLILPDGGYTKNKSDWFIKFSNGSEIWLAGLDDKERTERVLGTEYATIFFNESSQMTYDAITTALTRLAQKCSLRLKAYFDCNPPSPRHWLHKLFIEGVDPQTNEKKNAALYASMQLNPIDNVENLPEGYIENTLGALPERKRKRFRDGLWMEDNENALWKRDWIDRNRVQKSPDLSRLCVAIDPAVTDKETSDETGIVPCGKGTAMQGMKHPDKSHFYVLDDFTLRSSPAKWAEQAVKAYHALKADKIVAEVNNGGDLVKMNIRNADSTAAYEDVYASRGKMIRAEPVSALYEEGRVHHVGTFPELEDELCNWVPGEKSPNRLDALVWGISYLAGIHSETLKPSAVSAGRLGL